MKVRVALVGHVDHGKSTVIGRLLSDTGQAREDRREKVRSTCESVGRRFEYAFLLDALEEEQSQGITIDVTEVNWSHGGREIVFVDTPGHREFLKKMIGGASRVDAAILVVDALEGLKDTFRRQMHVLELLGVRQRIILLNKMDLAGWKEETWEARRREVFETQGLDPRTTPVIPVAAWHGENLLAPSDQMPWYRGPTLAQALSALEPARPEEEAPLRYFVQDVYRKEEQRIFVGRVEAGTLRQGQRIRFFPEGRETTVRSIEVHGEDRDEARCGDAIGITLEDALYLDRGALGFSPDSPPRLSREVQADLFWLDSEPVLPGDRLRIKAGTQFAEARVERIDSELDCETFAVQENPSKICSFGKVWLKFDSPWAFDAFSECPPSGRFVAMKGFRALGGGRWLAPTSDGPASMPRTLPGQVVWLTGLSGAGKSTIAAGLKLRLLGQGIAATVLDGDELRQGLCKDLGFSLVDRAENLRRAAEVARLMARAGLVVITASISPLREIRERAREIVGTDSFLEVFVDCPLERCEARDPKGLYERARRGLLSEFTGIDSPYEIPLKPDVTLKTDVQDPDSCVRDLLGAVLARRADLNRRETQA